MNNQTTRDDDGSANASDTAASDTAASDTAASDTAASDTAASDTAASELDHIASFNMLSMPATPLESAIIPEFMPDKTGPSGARIKTVLHRMRVEVQAPSQAGRVRAQHTMGEAVGTFDHRWLTMPDGHQAVPGQDPPPTAMNSSISQRFAMMDEVCRFADSEDGFRGFGTGRLFPVVVNGEDHVVAVGVGSIIEGFGRLKGCRGNYVVGHFPPVSQATTEQTSSGSPFNTRMFVGSFACTIWDAQENLIASSPLPALQPIPDADPGSTYLLFRGEKNTAVQPSGGDSSVLDRYQLRLVDADYAAGANGLRTARGVGAVVGGVECRTDLGAAATPDAAAPYTATYDFALNDPSGAAVGTFSVEIGQGSFSGMNPGDASATAFQFGGYGKIVKGTGPFEGVEASGAMAMLIESAAGIPPAANTLYLLHIADPGGEFGAAVERGQS